MSPVTDWHGFAVTQRLPDGVVVGHASLSRIASGWQIELAGIGPADWDGFARRLHFGTQDAATGRLLVHEDSAAGIYRAVALDADRLTGALLIAPNPIVIGREWLVARLGTPLDPGETFRLLDGRPSGAMVPRGATVCFCCDVGRNEITAAIASGHATVAAIGAATRAGTHCGRCHPRLERLIERANRGHLAGPALDGDKGDAWDAGA